MDDGSTDDSLAVCKRYESDSRVVVIHQDNGALLSHGMLASFVYQEILLGFWMPTMWLIRKCSNGFIMLWLVPIVTFLCVR